MTPTIDTSDGSPHHAAPSAVAVMPGWAGDEPLIFELSSDYTAGPRLVDCGVPERPLGELLHGVALRQEGPAVPAVPEPLLARHLGRLARRNHHLHHGIYPLGSCTMKYNPVVDEELAGLEGFTDLHPYQDEEDVQGALGLMWELDRMLAEITGMARMSLQPAAGAHGEWTGLRMIQAHHASRGDAARNRVLVPDSAHGTNPASAALASLDVVAVRSKADGTVDLHDLRSKLDPSVAAVMMTNPNTLGVFEKDILDISELAHAAGALLYYDGANLNALVGMVRPGDMGFDVVHLNLHKTFSTPHGGGGPGSGPVGVAPALVDFLPAPVVERSGDRFWLDHERPHSIGKVRAFYGNFGMLNSCLRLHPDLWLHHLGGRPWRRPQCPVPAVPASRRVPDGRGVGCDARVRRHRQGLQGSGVARSRRQQAAARLRGLRSHHLLPDHGPRGTHVRAHRDRVQGEPGSARPDLCRRRRRGRERSQLRPDRASQHPGESRGRGTGGADPRAALGGTRVRETAVALDSAVTP